MSFSPSTLKIIQQAGQSLFEAQQAVSADVRNSGARVMAFIESNPFSLENDDAYKQLRSLARIGHELQAMEAQLKALYASAAQAQAPEMSVLIALPNHGEQPKSHASKVNVEEATIKTETKKQPKASKAKEPRLSPNDTKIKDYLIGVLDRRSWTAVTHASIADSAGIPLGSVGVSLRRLIAGGWLKEGSKGTYRLAPK